MESELSVRELVAGIDRQGPLSISIQTQLLGISRGSFYYQPVPVSAEELAIKNLIDEIYTAHPIYGVRKMTWEINQQLQQQHKAQKY